MDGALASEMVFRTLECPQVPIKGPNIEGPQLGVGVPNHPVCLRKEVFTLGNRPWGCCKQLHQFGEPELGLPERSNQKDCASVLPDSFEDLREQRDWENGIKGEGGPIGGQCVPVL